MVRMIAVYDNGMAINWKLLIINSAMGKYGHQTNEETAQDHWTVHS
jgi:hypothetical protein